MPFVNRKAENFAVRLKALVENNYTQVRFNVAFKAQKTIGDMFSQSIVKLVKLNTFEKQRESSLIE